MESNFNDNQYKFTGKERDAESGLDYFGARYYRSSMGRFMSPDPSGLYYADPSDSQSFNLYAYVGNAPLAYVDPTGLSWLNQPCTSSGAGTGAVSSGTSLGTQLSNLIGNIFCGSDGGGSGGDFPDTLSDDPSSLRLFPTSASKGNHDITYRLRTEDGQHRPRGHYYIFEHQTQGEGDNEVKNGGRFRAGDRNYVSPHIQGYDNEFPDIVVGYFDSDQSFTFSRDRKYNPATQHQVWLKYGNGVQVPFQHINESGPNAPAVINGMSQLPLASVPIITGEH